MSSVAKNFAGNGNTYSPSARRMGTIAQGSNAQVKLTGVSGFFQSRGLNPFGIIKRMVGERANYAASLRLPYNAEKVGNHMEIVCNLSAMKQQGVDITYAVSNSIFTEQQAPSGAQKNDSKQDAEQLIRRTVNFTITVGNKQEKIPLNVDEVDLEVIKHLFSKKGDTPANDSNGNTKSNTSKQLGANGNNDSNSGYPQLAKVYENFVTILSQPHTDGNIVDSSKLILIAQLLVKSEQLKNTKSEQLKNTKSEQLQETNGGAVQTPTQKLEEALETAIESTQVAEMLAHSAQSTQDGSYEAAAKAYEKADTQWEKADAQWETVVKLWNLSQYEVSSQLVQAVRRQVQQAATEVQKEAIKIVKEIASNIEKMVNEYAEVCQYEKAIAELRRLYSLVAYIDSDQKKQVSTEIAQMLMKLASQHYRSGCLEASARTYKEAGDCFSDTELKRLAYSTAAEKCVEFTTYVAKEYKDAMNIKCESVQELLSDVMKMLTNVAEEYERAEQYSQAAECYVKVAESYVVQGNADAALDARENAVRNYEKVGQYSEAAKCYVEIVALHKKKRSDGYFVLEARENAARSYEQAMDRLAAAEQYVIVGNLHDSAYASFVEQSETELADQHKTSAVAAYATAAQLYLKVAKRLSKSDNNNKDLVTMENIIQMVVYELNNMNCVQSLLSLKTEFDTLYFGKLKSVRYVWQDELNKIVVGMNKIFDSISRRSRTLSAGSTESNGLSTNTSRGNSPDGSFAGTPEGGSPTNGSNASSLTNQGVNLGVVPGLGGIVRKAVLLGQRQRRTATTTTC